jgi:2-dehydropantoate 2-reductase
MILRERHVLGALAWGWRSGLKVCVFGVGAIGGFIGYRLAAAGCDLSGVARGATLAALRERGLRFAEDGRAGTARVESLSIRASSDPVELGEQDLVVLAVKAPALAQAAASIAPLLGPETVVLPAMNGVPWWFFHGLGRGQGRGSDASGAFEGWNLASVDPSGSIAAAIPPSRVLGCVVHIGASCPEPGLVKALPLRRLIIGEPTGADTPRLSAVAGALRGAGFDVDVTDSIQREIWYKLWGNMTMNPVSALTGATMDRIIDDPLVYRFCCDVMAEAKRVGARIGCGIDQTEEDRMTISRSLGAFKTSMLQDVEAGRPVELDAIVSSVREIGALVGEPTPNIDALLGLARLRARTLGLYPEGVR